MRKAFALVELLIVIMVIAILIGIALPRFRSMQDEANTAKAVTELKKLQTAVESYFTRIIPHTYPATGVAWQANLMDRKLPIVALALPDPFKPTSQYQFAKSANGLYYVIFSVGPDGVADISGIADNGEVQGGPDDDIYVSNGTNGKGLLRVDKDSGTLKAEGFRDRRQ